MGTKEKTQKIIHAFSTKNKDAIAGYSTEELADAIDDLDWRNPGVQKTIKREIERRESNSEKKHQSNMRAIGYLVALAIALIAGLIIAKL